MCCMFTSSNNNKINNIMKTVNNKLQLVVTLAAAILITAIFIYNSLTHGFSAWL